MEVHAPVPADADDAGNALPGLHPARADRPRIPLGVARAWPVYDAKDLWEPIGNVLEEPISEVWKRYRFKVNHYSKYLGRSIHTVAQGV